MKRFGVGLLAAAGSLLLAMPAFAGVSTMRLNGDFGMQDETAGDNNEACVIADFTQFQVFGEAQTPSNPGLQSSEQTQASY
jgi:hypothetical protein